jgi:hypothetical protein
MSGDVMVAMQTTWNNLPSDVQEVGTFHVVHHASCITAGE